MFYYRVVMQLNPVNSYLRLIRMYRRPPFRDDQRSNIILLIRISQYSYYFIRSIMIRIKWIELYNDILKECELSS